MQEAYLRSVPAGEPAHREQTLLTQFRYQAAMSITNPDARADALALVCQIDRTFVPAAVSYGDALVAADRAEQAVRLWERTFRALPRSIFIERILSQQPLPKDRERTIALLKKHEPALGANSAHAIVARVALQDADVTTCAAELEAITPPLSPAIHLLWADLHRKRGETERAMNELSKAVEDVAACVRGFRCLSCGRVIAEWTGYCTGCGEWDTFRSPVDAPAQRTA